MKKVFLLSFIAVITASGLILPGCKKQLYDLSSYTPSANTKLDTLRIYNLLPDISGTTSNIGYLVYLNDSLNLYTGKSLYSKVGFGAAPALTLPATGGTFTIKLTQFTYSGSGKTVPAPPVKNPPASAIVCQKTITVPPHSGFGNIIFYDSLGTVPTLKYVPCTTVDPGAPAPGNFKIRLVNFAYNTGTYPQSAGPQFNCQLQYRDSTAVMGDDNVPFAGVGDYKEIDYGTEQFLVYNLSSKAYLTNCSPFNDVTNAFGISPYTNVATATNQLFPRVFNYSNNPSSTAYYTLETGNIGSYPFSPGGCYTVMVIGNMYSVSLDRQYGPGVLDNVGKVQVVNANPNQQDMEVKISYPGGTTTDIPSLRFGASSVPLTVPAGPVNITLLSQGQTIYNYNIQVPRLADYTYYYTADNNALPFFLPVANVIVALDYLYGSQSNLPSYQLIKFNELDLSPDAGTIFFTTQTAATGGLESQVAAGKYDVSFKNMAQITGAAGYGNNVVTDGVSLPTTAINVRLTALRPDSLASKLVAKLSNPFTPLPAPGSYTAAAVGLVNTTDPAKKIRVIIVKHTNFTSKAK